MILVPSEVFQVALYFQILLYSYDMKDGGNTRTKQNYTTYTPGTGKIKIKNISKCVVSTKIKIYHKISH